MVRKFDETGMANTANRKSILIADDDPTIRDLYKSELEKGGYIVFEAVDGVSALQVIRDRRPDLVLLDVMMPGKSGLDVLAEMKQDPAIAGTSVFILSVLGDTDDKARGLSLGADRYIAKAETIPGKVIKEVDDFFRSQSKNA